MMTVKIDDKELKGIISGLPKMLETVLQGDSSLAESGRKAAAAAAPVDTGKLQGKIRINKPRARRGIVTWTVSPGIGYGTILAAGVPTKYQREGKGSLLGFKQKRIVNWKRRQEAISKGWRIEPREFMRKAQAAMTAGAPLYSRTAVVKARELARRSGA